MSAVHHHWASIRDALANERRMNAAAFTTDESDFLPAAMEIVERPVSPTARITMWLLLAGFAVTLLWLVIGRIDIVASAPGRLVPASRIKLVQPAGPGVVRAILVHDGQRVRAGQPLVMLDPTTSDADTTQAVGLLRSAELDVARGRAILSALDGHGLAFVAPPGTSADVAATQTALARATLDGLTASTAGRTADRLAAEAARAGAQQQAIKLAETMPLLDQQIAANEAMLAKGYVSRLRVIEMRRQRLAADGDRRVALREADRQGAQVAVAASGVAQGRAEARSRVLSMLATAQSDAAARREELAKARQRSSLQILRAPVDGVVAQLSLHTIGGVVEAVKPVMEIVPADAPLVAEGMVRSRDAGFVHVGQRVAVKVDAFPFGRFGTIPGRIVAVSADAIDDEKLGAVFTVRAALDPAWQRDHALPVSAGMTLGIDIKTGNRRLIDYLTSPARETIDGAAHER